MNIQCISAAIPTWGRFTPCLLRLRFWSQTNTWLFKTPPNMLLVITIFGSIATNCMSPSDTIYLANNRIRVAGWTGRLSRSIARLQISSHRKFRILSTVTGCFKVHLGSLSCSYRLWSFSASFLYGQVLEICVKWHELGHSPPSAVVTVTLQLIFYWRNA